MKEASTSPTLINVHYQTEPSDGDAAWVKIGYVPNTTIRVKWDTAVCNVWKWECTHLKLNISVVGPILAAPDTFFADRINIEQTIASLDTKVCPHARGELCTEADEICGRWADPYVDTSVVCDISCDVRAKQCVEGFTLCDGEGIDGSQTNRWESNKYNQPSNLHVYTRKVIKDNSD